MSSFRGSDDKQGERLSGLGLTPMPRDGAARDGVNREGVNREGVTRHPILPAVPSSPTSSSPTPSSPLASPQSVPGSALPPVTRPPVTPSPVTSAPAAPSPVLPRETMPSAVTLREAGEEDGALRQAPPPIRDVASLSTLRPSVMRPSALVPSAIRPPVIPILGAPATVALDASDPDARDAAELASAAGERAASTETTTSTDDAAIEAPPSIGSDERRMHVRAYDFWAQLLKDRAFPTIADLEVATLGEFEDHAVLLDFTASTENPGVAYLGREIRESCGLTGPIAHLSDVPEGSLLTPLSDHYPRIVADEAPTSFEAESRNSAGANLLYRGILLPFSSDGDQIDVILGVLNWKEAAGVDMAAALEQEVAVAAFANPAPAVTAPVSAWAARPEISDDTADDDNTAGNDAVDETQVVEVVAEAPTQREVADDDAGLAESLEAARATAVAARDADVRGRSALYRAISSAYDFSLSADAHPTGYADLLADAGLKQQDRAPMTPVIKLIFGADYDKTRITEYATVIGHARAKGLGRGSLATYLASYEGGLKALVKAERAAKRGQKPADATSERDMELLMHVLRTAPALGFVDYDAGDNEFILMVGRKMSDNEVGVLVPFKDQALLEKVLRKLAAS